MAKLFAIVSLMAIAAGCGKPPSERFAALTEEFVYTTLSFSPANATGVGLHQYKKQNLDELLDDVGPGSLDKQERFYEDFQRRLSEIKTDQLTPEDQADFSIIQDQTALALLDFTKIHTHLHSPQFYVETLGNALFNPFVLEYAPQRTRIQNIMARLQKVPLYLDQASSNLISAPTIWTKVAMEENQGNLNLVDKTIRAALPEDLRDPYARVARPALEAMQKFQTFLKDILMNRNNVDWRLGQQNYTLKFRYALESGIEADTALQMAETQLAKVRAHMLELALPLHHQLIPGHGDHNEISGDARQNQVIGEVLAQIAKRHSTPESYMQDARQDLDEARAFVQEKHLLTLPTRANLQVIPTPEFMRGVYSVGGFNAAPALEPQLGAFYWVTPIPPDWPAERTESKLREYNFYKLKLLTIHEAMPGHYVQMEFANDVQPQTRRVLRSVYGNGPYIEGWGQYSTQAMLDEGFLNHSPELALTFAKEELRVIGNLILDVRLQMLNMTEEEAMELMQQKTFQEKEEASGKLQRAQLSSCQLPMYFLGWRGWLRVRDGYKQAKGASYGLAAFHDAALKEGSVPLPVLERLLK